MPFEQVKRDVKQYNSFQSSSAENRQAMEKSCSKIKKSVEVVKKLEETFMNVLKAFEICPEIKQAAVILGATPLTPTEVYVIQLPPLNPDADNLSGNSCVKSLFRQLFMQDPLRDVKEINPTKMSLHLLAPRDSQLTWFYPKPLYRIPLRGAHFEFNLHSKCGAGSHNLSKDCSATDLSGFELLDSSNDNVSINSFTVSSQGGTVSNSGASSLTAENVCVGSLTDLAMADEIYAPNYVSNEQNSIEVHHVKKDLHIKSTKSVNSVLSQTSVLLNKFANNSERQEHQRISVGGETSSAIEYIWFQSPVLIKGYRDHAL